MPRRHWAQQRTLFIATWVISMSSLIICAGVKFESRTVIKELKLRSSALKTGSDLPSHRFLHLQIQIAEQREWIERHYPPIDSPVSALAYLNRWALEDSIPEDQTDAIQNACQVLRDSRLPDNYREFCLARLSQSSTPYLVELASQLRERWNDEHMNDVEEVRGQPLFPDHRGEGDKGEP